MLESYSKWVENTVGKREIARYKQFLLFPQCFQEVCFLGASEGVIEWEWVKVSHIKSSKHHENVSFSFIVFKSFFRFAKILVLYGRGLKHVQNFLCLIGNIGAKEEDICGTKVNPFANDKF